MKKILSILAIFAMIFISSCTKEPVVIVIPLEDKVEVVEDNLYYNETQLGVEKRYWVELKDRTQEATSQDAISWYVNDELKGTGAEFMFSPSSAGKYSVKYVLDKKYSVIDQEVSAVMSANIYSSEGVYILNEPNMTADESTRGINKHTFGSTTVERFIVGDYSSFGVTNQYIVNWAGKIYNVAPYTQMGIVFSQFMAEDGTFVKAIESLSGRNEMSRAFAGVTPEMGILTTSGGAYLVNLSDLTLSATILSGSENSKNIFVADGYVFIIVDAEAKAYKIDGLTTTTEPVVLGAAKTGFVQSKDGDVWAAADGNLLRIDTRDLSVEQVVLPDEAKITFAGNPWKQCSWTASTSDNTFFFTKGSYEISKYDIDNATLDAQFVVSSESMEGYKNYGTSLFYDAQRDELIAMGIKPGWGANSAYNGMFLLNAKTGVKNYGVIYNTPGQGEEGYLNMWFPAMLAPMKAY